MPENAKLRPYVGGCVIPILPHTFIPRQKQAWSDNDVAELPLLPPKAYTSCLQGH